MRFGLVAGIVLIASTASAQEQAPEAEVKVDLERDVKPPEVDVNAPPPEAPPPPPYKRTLVLDSNLGAMGFLGKFGKVAPPGFWFHTQLGYEIFKWLMVLGEGEVSFTDTSNAQDPPKTRAFPIYGFGGGARFTWHFTDRLGAYVQPTVGLMKADIAHNALSILNFRDAESFGLYAGARLGIEWYMVDRHFALGLTSGIRLAQGFEKAIGSDTPLALDGAASIRYAF